MYPKLHEALFDYCQPIWPLLADILTSIKLRMGQVWKAWTNSTMPDLWWAPRPWRTETKSLDFEEGFTIALGNPDEVPESK